MIHEDLEEDVAEHECDNTKSSTIRKFMLSGIKVLYYARYIDIVILSNIVIIILIYFDIIILMYFNRIETYTNV